MRCRRLAEKIRAARVNKERSLQLQEKAQIAAQEAEYDKVYDTVGHAGDPISNVSARCSCWTPDVSHNPFSPHGFCTSNNGRKKAVL